MYDRLSALYQLLRRSSRTWAPIVALVLLRSPLFSQTQFFTLSTAEGLSDNYISTMTVDRNGYLWVGTGSGLNRFNGRQVERFFASDHPALRSDIIRHVDCDSANRIWVINHPQQLTLIDANRRFIPVVLRAEEKEIRVRWILSAGTGGTYFWTEKGCLRVKDKWPDSLPDTLDNTFFDRIDLGLPDSVFESRFYMFARLTDNQFAIGSVHSTIHIRLDREPSGKRIPCRHCVPVGSLDGRDIAIYHSVDKRLFALRPQDTTTYPLLQDVRDQAGLPLQGFVNRMTPVDNEDFVIPTRGNGVYLYNRISHRLTHYPYAAGDPSGPANPFPNIVAASRSGWVFLGCPPHGISYFNHHAVIGQRIMFRDRQGKSYDREIVNLATQDNDTYYLVIEGGDLLVWQRSTNTSAFVPISIKKNFIGLPHQLSFAIVDKTGRIWVSAFGEGLVILEPGTHKVLRRLDLTQGLHELRYKNDIRYMCIGPDEQVWICSSNGVTRVSPATFEIDHLTGTVMDTIRTYITNHIAWPEPGKLWAATENQGVFAFDLTASTVRRLNHQTGDLPSNSTYCINNDRQGNIYVGSDSGLTIFLENGGKLSYTMANGLLNNRLEVLLLDDKNRMWFGNDVGIGCFNIADTTIRMFDERFGLSVQGFRVYSYHQNNDGELVWGTERGLQYFYPDSLYDQQINLQASIHRLESRDVETWITGPVHVTLPAGNDFVTFHFGAIDYSKHIRTFYQYKLDGLDPDWITVMDQQTARYNSLHPGTYTFRVRASHDGENWHPATYDTTLTLQPHFHQTNLFRLLVGLLVAGGGLAVFGAYNRQVRRRAEELESEAILQYFASTINRHKKTDEMLWDVARNCISKLDLADCAIYLMDPERQVVIQRAAIGPKNPRGDVNPDPLEIPVGRGIPGAVAATGSPILVGDTEKDPRYVLDDRRMLSEIAVPIVLEGQVIGVIDSGHPKRNFFTSRHLRMLTTIAVLMAAQIRRNEAEDAKRRAELEVLQNKQQAAESRLQSLRLQMNPHFLFNALNSIQQMILANEELVATKYLSRFSKLLRSILVHSDKESVTLKEELDMLRLYIELESVRFKESFTFAIDCDDDIDPDEVKIPTLLVQPFVENAIWHGLMHKEGERHLAVSFREEDDLIHCVIEDNGIGRQKAGQLKQISGQDKKHTSKGVAVARERLQALQKNDKPAGSITFTDLTDHRGNALGTRVDILFPPQR